MKRIVIVFAILVATFSILLGIKVHQMNAEQSKPAGGSAVIEGTEADVSSRLMARIQSIAVEEGDAVKAGDVLVKLDCAEPQSLLQAASARLLAAEHQAEAARAQVEAALGSANAAAAGINAAGAQRQALQSTQEVTNRQVKRIDRLATEGGATASDLERAAAQADQLAKQVDALDSQLNAARGQARAAKAQAQAAKAQAEAAVNAIGAAQADVLRAQSLVDECNIEAPIDGFVETRAFEPLEVVLPGSKILSLVRIDRVEATFYLPNRELAAAKAGMAVTAIADAHPGKIFSGKVERVAAQAEFTPRNVQTRDDRDRLVYAVTAVFENAAGELRPGMPVEITVGESR
jgi:HlyD family secretion protein